MLQATELPSGHKKVASQSGTVACESGYLAKSGDIEETRGEAELRRQLLALNPRICNLSTYEQVTGEPGRQGTTGFQMTAIVFPDSDAASEALPLLRRSLVDATELGTPEDVARPDLGNESVLGVRWRSRLSSRESGPSFEVHIWRLRNVAIRLSSTVSPGMSEADVVAIGQRIDARALR